MKAKRIALQRKDAAAMIVVEEYARHFKFDDVLGNGVVQNGTKNGERKIVLGRNIHTTCLEVTEPGIDDEVIGEREAYMAGMLAKYKKSLKGPTIIQEKELKYLGNGDANSHVCKCVNLVHLLVLRVQYAAQKVTIQLKLVKAQCIELFSSADNPICINELNITSLGIMEIPICLGGSISSTGSTLYVLMFSCFYKIECLLDSNIYVLTS
ncbi:Serine decarboxylase [Glycine soja]